MDKQNESRLVKQAILGTGLSESIYQDSNGEYYTISNNIFAHSQLSGHTFTSLEAIEKAYKKQGITVTMQDPSPNGIVPGMN